MCGHSGMKNGAYPNYMYYRLSSIFSEEILLSLSMKSLKPVISVRAHSSPFWFLNISSRIDLELRAIFIQVTFCVTTPFWFWGSRYKSPPPFWRPLFPKWRRQRRDSLSYTQHQIVFKFEDWKQQTSSVQHAKLLGLLHDPLAEWLRANTAAPHTIYQPPPIIIT